MLSLIAAAACAPWPRRAGDDDLRGERARWTALPIIPDTEPARGRFSSGALWLNTKARIDQAFRCTESPTVGTMPDVVRVKFRPGVSLPLKRERLAAVDGRVVGGRWSGDEILYTVWLWPTRECVAADVVKRLQNFPEVEFATEEILLVSGAG